jgi:CarD family transcriptional regulator
MDTRADHAGERVRRTAVSLERGVEVKEELDMAKPKKIAAKAKDLAFEKGDFVVYPTHGVGRVIDIEAKEIAGHKLDLFVISFEQERMMLRVPVAKAKISGLRKLSSRKIMESALVTLKGRSRVSRAMWNRRAQEYEAKINSGDPVSIAEVVRDLHRNAGQPDQSYSERQIYEAALDRLARELAAVERIDKDLATQKLNSVLQKVA